MGFSKHYSEERKARERAIIEIGIGETIYSTVAFDTKRNRSFIYEISSTAILTVRAYDEPTLIISRYPARPSRIRKYWENATEEIIKISIEHTRMGLVF